ncbi:nicotinate-nucleotide--dimethylbenzimidazole phosphoribosyltransferase [Alicyclobacillus acidoterrestris]|uniref:nicotinate-nucleotide--dimethylbenzimidazole phosphoribosyltransferase n=1 Tax=Alicyclobacillus acidoterrestris TaxID=1450 RepID=UPI003F52B09E
MSDQHFETLQQHLPSVQPVAGDVAELAQDRLDNLTKPLGSLGQLEPLICRIAAIQARMIPALIHPHFLVFAADHGVAMAHEVSRYEAKVTEEMTVNIAMGTSTSAVLARQYGMPVRIVDVGVARSVRHPRVIVRKVAHGTADFTQGPAMNRQELWQALQVGIDEVKAAVENGCDCILLGEMGIGNTSAASALAAVLLELPVEAVVGRGTGVDAERLRRKRELIEHVVHRWYMSEDVQSPDGWVRLMEQFGGFELVAMAGAMLEAASHRIPVVLDGLLAGVSALWAAKLQPHVADYLIAGHQSPEPAHRAILEALGCDPLLHLGLRVGEGTGALMAWPVITSALAVMAETATFADARVSNPHGVRVATQGGTASSPRTVSNVDAAGYARPVARDFTQAEIDAVYKAILARRDIRVFLPDKLPDDVVERILQAGHHGPSVGYMQPWDFIVIEDKETLRALQAVVERERIRAGEAYPDAKRDYYLRLKVEGLVEAPLTICVTNDGTRGGPHVLGRNTIPETDLMSTACAIQNMWLAARAEGVGMGWVSIYEKADVREILGIPDNVDPAALLTLGYTPHFPDIPLLERVGWGTRRDFAKVVYANRWGTQRRN